MGDRASDQRSDCVVREQNRILAVNTRAQTHPTPVPAGPFRSCLRALLLLALPLPAALAQPADSPQPVEAQGCAQLPFTQDIPEVVLDPRVFLEADEVTLQQGGVSELLGGVRLRQGDRVFSAEALSFDEARRVVSVRSQSLFRNPEVVVRSQESRFDLNQGQGLFLDTEFSLPSRAARGEARELAIQTSGQIDLKGASYTTCAPGSRAWLMEAGDIRLDHGDGLVSVFMHMSEVDVSPGDVVAAGQRLGASGNTGRTTGPHLHWAVKWRNPGSDDRSGDFYIDPALLLELESAP